MFQHRADRIILISEHVSGAALDRVLKQFHGTRIPVAINPAYAPAPMFFDWH